MLSRGDSSLTDVNLRIQKGESVLLFDKKGLTLSFPSGALILKLNKELELFDDELLLLLILDDPKICALEEGKLSFFKNGLFEFVWKKYD